MYLAVNLPHQITNIGDILLLTAYHMLRYILKFTGPSPRLMMRLHGPQIHILRLFWNLLPPKPHYMLQWVPI